jgi:hypothetical protein
MGVYLGMSPQAWSLIFDGLQAISITAGVAFGVYQLRDLQRQRRAASFEKMFGEWRENLPAQRKVLADMPMHNGTLPERAVALAQEIAKVRSSRNKNAWCGLSETLEVARDVVHSLNDLGAIVERGVVHQEDFFRQFHYRISELVYLLEPYVLLVSTVRNGRWGLRLIRLGIETERYHRSSKIDANLPLSVRNHVIVGTSSSSRISIASRIIPKHNYIPSRYETAEDVNALMREIERLLAAADDPDISLEVLRPLFNV